MSTHKSATNSPRGCFYSLLFALTWVTSPFFSLCLSSNPSSVNGLQFKTSESCWLSRTEGVKKWSRDHRQMEVRDKREGRQKQSRGRGGGVESSKLEQALPPPPPSATNTPSIYSATHLYNHIWNGGKTGRLSGGGGMVGWCYLRDSSRCRFSQHTCHVCYSSAWTEWIWLTFNIQFEAATWHSATYHLAAPFFTPVCSRGNDIHAWYVGEHAYHQCTHVETGVSTQSTVNELRGKVGETAANIMSGTLIQE